MALQPFNVQALQDPGLSTAASLLGTGIANFSEGLRNRATNRNALYRQLLTNKAAEDEARLKAEGEIATAQAGAPKKLLDYAKTALEVQKAGGEQGVSPEIVDALTGASENAQLRALLGGQGGTVAAAPAQRGLASRLLGSDVVDLGKAIGGGIKNLFDRDEKPTAPQQMPASELLEGATVAPQAPAPKLVGGVEKEQEPYRSKYAESPAGQQLAAETTKKIADAKTAGYTARQGELTNLTEDYLPNPAEYQRNRAQGVLPQAKDPSGYEMSTKLTPDLYSARVSYANLTPSQRAEYAKSVSDAATSLDTMEQVSEQLLRYRNPGFWSRIKYNTYQDKNLGPVSRLVFTGNDASPEDAAVLSKINDTIYNAIKMAKATGQASNSISDADVAGLTSALGNPSASQEELINQLAKFTSQAYLGTMKNATVSDGPLFDKLHSRFQSRVGAPVDFQNPELYSHTVSKFKGYYSGLTPEQGNLISNPLNNLFGLEASKKAPVKSQPVKPVAGSSLRPTQSVNSNELTRITVPQIMKMDPVSLSQVDVTKLDPAAIKVYKARSQALLGGQ